MTLFAPQTAEALDWATRIQAGASVVQAVFAVVLVVVTIKYVKLTGALASASSAQVALERERQALAEQKGLMRLEHVARRVRDYLSAFPSGLKDADRADRSFREHPVWDDEDIRMLQEYAAAVGRRGEELVVKAAPPLEWMRGRVDDVRATTRQQGYSWQRFDWDAWEKRYERAVSSLEELERLAAEQLRTKGA